MDGSMATFYVTHQGRKVLICYNLARNLGLIGEVSNLNTSDDREILKIPQRVVDLVARAYEGESKVNMDPCRIELDPKAKPVKIPTRRLPVAYWEDMKLELEKLKRMESL
jgi:hypothetical protein